jgi:hypothetical protein
MASLYLRYRGADLQQLSQLMAPVMENLVAKKVVKENGNELLMPGKLARLQCAKCFYINYLAESEPRSCLRCSHAELHDFPKKKA